MSPPWYTAPFRVILRLYFDASVPSRAFVRKLVEFARASAAAEASSREEELDV